MILSLARFAGMIPRSDRASLPEGYADEAINLDVGDLSIALKGLRMDEYFEAYPALSVPNNAWEYNGDLHMPNGIRITFDNNGYAQSVSTSYLDVDSSGSIDKRGIVHCGRYVQSVHGDPKIDNRSYSSFPISVAVYLSGYDS